jgi:GT2 family glycosyltransferase
MKIGIGGAGFFSNDQHVAMAVETLDSMVSEEHELEFAFFMNWVPPLGIKELSKYGKVFDNDRNNVSRAWNRAISYLLGQGCRYVIVPNLDLVLKADAIDNLVRFAERTPEHILWTGQVWHYLKDDGAIPGIQGAPIPDIATPHPHFSLFMVDERLFNNVGPFDERFEPAYNEDLDMHWRIRLAGESAACYEGARFYHHGSQTIRLDMQLKHANDFTHAANDRYFEEKWSYKPPTADDPFTDGMFRYPFNNPEKVGAEKAWAATWPALVELTEQ